MNRGRSPLKYRPKPETFNELVQSGVRTDSSSKLEGDLSKKKKAVESQNARKDESQRRSPSRLRRQSESPKGHVLPTNERRFSLPTRTNSEKSRAPVLSRTNSEKNRAPVLSRTNSERNRVPGLPRSNSGQFNKNDDDSKSKEEDDLDKAKKIATRNFMKHTRSFNAKSQKPMDLKDERVRKKAEQDPGGIKQKIEEFCTKTCRNPYCSLNHNKPTPQKTFSYLKSRSRSPSIDSQCSPRNLRRMNSIEKRNSNLSGSAKQNREDKKKREKKEIEVCEKVVEEIKRENELKFENLFEGNEYESLLEVEENEIDMKKLFEGQENLLEFEKNEINMEDEAEIFEKDNWEKHEVINGNISENNDDEVSYPLETVTENEILENDRVINENVPIEINETDELETIHEDENSFALETIHEDENSEKYEVMDTKYDEISDSYVLSSCNDEIDSSLQEISIEDELSKLIGTNDSKFDEFESIETVLINQENQEVIQNNNSASVNPIIEDIVTNKLEEMEEVSTGEDEEKEEEEMETKRGSKKWLVDYALRKLIRKLETSDKLNDVNKVSVLIEAYENVIPLAMTRKVAPRQVSGY